MPVLRVNSGAPQQSRDREGAVPQKLESPIPSTGNTLNKYGSRCHTFPPAFFNGLLVSRVPSLREPLLELPPRRDKRTGDAIHPGASRGLKPRGSGGDTTFSGNDSTGNDSTTTGTSAGGGAIWSGGNTDLRGCTFTSNTAQDDGGAMYIIRPGQSTAVEIVACIFDGNTSELSGGAVYEGDVNLAITYINSLFVLNEAKGTGTDEGGGAVFNGGSTNVSYVNCTFVDNMAEDGSGGGIFVHSGGDAVVTNGIFWDNCDGSTCATEDESAQIHLNSASATVTHTTLEGCDVPGFCDESTNKAVEPSLRGVGQPNPYALTATGNGSLIDFGDGAESTHGTCPSANGTSVDLAGNTRFVYKSAQCGGSNANVADMGAYEVQ
jgi:hypothetical protein